MAWIRNTSRYPDDEVRELVKFAQKGVDMSRVCVNVKGARGRTYRGRAYCGVPEISNAPPTAQYLVTIGIGAYPEPVGPRNYNGKAPDEVGPRNRRPFYTLHGWREVLVFVAAHEARHIHQFRHGKRRSEVDTDRFAVKALECYRATIGAS